MAIKIEEKPEDINNDSDDDNDGEVDAAIDPNRPDSYIFEANWLGGLCKAETCEIEEYKINREIFNIHGLWPEKAHSILEGCDTEKFDFKNLEPKVQQEVKRNWVSIHYSPFRNVGATAKFV